MYTQGFLKGGGEMGDRTRRYPWAESSLGPPDQWPKSLQTTVSIILSSRFPMFLWWGPDLIQFYNDAYRPSLGSTGKHPNALGQKGKDCWPEIWDIIYPLIDQVRTAGEPTWSEDQLVPIYRDGAIQDVYWTFGYSAVLGEADKVEGVLVICTETTQKVVYLQELAESKKELEFAIDAADLGTWDLDPATNRFTANARLKQWFGLQPDEEIDLSKAIDVMHEADRDSVTSAIRYALQPASGGYYDIDYRIIEPGTGIERIVRAKGKALFDEQNKPIRFNGILQDITDQKIARRKIEDLVTARTKQLAEANRNLERSNADLGQFAHVASHDLQEPVRKIATYASLLAVSIHDAAAQNYLQKITTAADNMKALIRDILVYSQVANQNTLFEPVNLQQVVQDLQNEFELLIGQKRAILDFQDLPIIQAIPLQMNQLFGNLLSNALKYTRPDIPPAISIHAGREGGYYHIRISDNGIGFEQKHADQIFHIFQRLHRKSEFSGTGIGLAICKKIVANHGGEIHATGNPGEGATFHIRLPVQPEKPATGGQPPSENTAT
jgi:PAS domain S-box-containing protein